MDDLITPMNNSEQMNQGKVAGDSVCDRLVHSSRVEFLGFNLLNASKQLLAVSAVFFVLSVFASAEQNVISPANGGNLESFTGENAPENGASLLTNGITQEDGWVSPKKPTGSYEFVYSFNGGNSARLTNAVIHGGNGFGLNYTENVEVWTSVDGVNYNMAGSGTLANAANDTLTVNLSNVVVSHIKLVVTSGYKKIYWALGEFVVTGDVVYPLTVDNGTGDGVYVSGADISIQADTISGQTFDSWVIVSGNPLIADANNPSTTLTMQAGGAVVAASYNQAPIWETNPIVIVDAQEAAPVSETLSSVAVDPESDNLVFSKVSGPAWLSVANNGDLIGVPGDDHVGVNKFTVSISDGVNPAVLATLEVNVAPTAFTAWAMSQGISNRTEDSDGDGYNNEFEYLMGMNPKAASNQRIPSVAMSGGRPTFTYTYRTDAAISYRVLASTDLKNWVTADVTPGVPSPNGDGTSTVTVVSNASVATAPKQFFMLEAVE